MEQIREILLVFVQNIKKTREKQNLSIRELAKRIGYDRNCLSLLECGEQNITYETAMKLAKELNAPFPALFSRNYSINDEDYFCEDDFLMIFIENLKRELKQKSIMQLQVYIECGVQESVISRVLNGKIDNPTLGTLCKIAAAITDGNMTRLFSREGGE